jgi:hypothetical protein
MAAFRVAILMCSVVNLQHGGSTGGKRKGVGAAGKKRVIVGVQHTVDGKKYRGFSISHQNSTIPTSHNS